METEELLKIVSRDEDGKNQFKANVTNETSLGQELVAFSNCDGGEIFIGVSNDGTFSALTRQDMGRLNQLVSNAASQQVRPSINPKTENIQTLDGLVMRVEVAAGLSKLYMDKDGVIWVKSGSDKRKATSREEIQRLFQQSGLIHGDEIPVHGMTLSDLDLDYFKKFFKSNFGKGVDEQEVSLAKLLENMNLKTGDSLNVSGALLFAKDPRFKLPVFIVKAIAFPGDEIHAEKYDDSQDISGKLADVFQTAIGFIQKNIRHIQANRSVNSPGKPEVPRIVLEELLANALIHRDYFISAPVQILVFANRIEIKSPGHLPNNLTVENIKMGNSNIRNPILASYATKMLPYRGIGTGIIRALKEYSAIEFENDVDGNRFTVTIRRGTVQR